MADSFLPYQNPTVTDAKLDTESLSVGANTVQRERIRIAGAAAVDLAPVDATFGLAADVKRSALPSGAATETTLGTRLSQTDFDTMTGSLTETAPATDTASSGLNGRLQRIAQRITSLIALIPAALTGSGNFKVAVVESTATVTTSEAAPTTVLHNKTTVTTAGTRVALATSTTCKSVTIKALAANTGIIYVGGSSVSSANGLQLAAGDSVSLDIANLNTVNIDSSVNSEGVTYLGVN